VKAAGAAYLTYLGLRGLWRALAGGQAVGAPAAGASHREATGISGLGAVTRGVMTNLLNPPVILFYMTFLPQFIGPGDAFFARFVVLAATHVSMSLVWLSMYAVALGVLAERMARPVVRRALEGVTGALLVGFGVRLLFR
jgi:threonine/homoserine/homoserine lactone efflux protein